MSEKLNDIKKEFERIIASWAGIELISEEAGTEERKIYEQKLMKRISRKLMWLFIILLPMFLLVFGLGRKTASPHQNHSKKQGASSKDEKKIKFWTCSMHPQIKLPNNESKCPICFMDLVPVFEGGGDDGPRSMSLTPSAVKLAEIEAQPAIYRRLTHTVRMVGKISYDETKVANISLWTPGRSRLDRMLVAFTGAWVQKDEPLLEVYSPDLIAAQGEYLSAYQASKLSKHHSKEMLQAHRDNLLASERKLLDLGMTKSQIKQLEKRNLPEETTIVYSPVSGTVINKLVNEGEWHGRGMSIYRIADLSKVWVKLDAYESDMTWIRYAQEVEFETEAFPGEIFKGRIAFIDPFLDEQTRTVKLRVNVSNDNGKLKPGMFVRATIKVRVAEGGQVIDETLADKWVCPVHPEVIREKEGHCDSYVGIDTKKKCERKLIPASKLSFTKDHTGRSRVLSIPYTAPLLTGKRAVVYVEQKIKDYDDEGNAKVIKLRYQGIEVKLGPRVDNYYIVLSGLEEGQQVVVEGAYKLDSALQILAKPSMMNPEEEQKQTQLQQGENIPPYAIADSSYHEHFNEVLNIYFRLSQNLARDDIEKSYVNLLKMRQILQKISTDTLHVPKILKQRLHNYVDSLKSIVEKWDQKDLGIMRENFSKITKVVTSYLQDFGHKFDSPLYKMFCPMVLKKGDFWWQNKEKLMNPYLGTKMQDCGENQQILEALKPKQIGKIAAVSGQNWDKNAPYHPVFKKLIIAYLKIGEIMAQDRIKGVIEQKKIMQQILGNIDFLTLSKDKRMGRQMIFLKQVLKEMQGGDIKQLRRDYLDISGVLIHYLENFGHLFDTPLYIIHCPMYRHDMGGSWIQNHKKVTNPYYGSEMLRCGDVEGVIPSIKNIETNGGE